MDNQMVVFKLGSEHFGVNITQVESIIKLQEITRLPQVASYMEGVTNLRGKVLPVIDLRKRFGLPVRETGKDSRIIVVNIDQTVVGLIVDAVSEVLTLPEQAVEAIPAITTTVNTPFLTGIAKLEQRLVILLDLNRVLMDEERLSLQNL